MKRIAVLALLAAPPAWAEVGQVVEAEGGLILRGSESIVAEAGTAVEEGDLLQTTPTGLIHVLMTDETKFVVGPGTSISIDTALIGSDSSTFDSLAVGMTGGLLRMISGNSASEAYRVNTPSATMGIRGTAFDNCVVRDDLLIVHQGTVEACLRNPVTGETDLASCVETEAQENTCPVTAAVLNPDGEGNIGPAQSTAILQCGLSFRQEELGVREDFRVNGDACRAAADVAREGIEQPEDDQPTEDPPPEEEEDETRDTIPPGGAGGGNQAAATGSASNSSTGFLIRRSGQEPDDLCSKDEIINTLNERVGIYDALIAQNAGKPVATLALTAARATLVSAIDKLRRAPLVDDECATLEAYLATACMPTSSHATPQSMCKITVQNSGL